MTEPTPVDPSASSELQVVWPTDVSTSATIINQCAFSWDQDNRDLVYMMLGHVGPPLFSSPETVAGFLEESNGKIRVTPRGSFAVSTSRAFEIWDALGRHLGVLPNEQG